MFGMVLEVLVLNPIVEEWVRTGTMVFAAVAASFSAFIALVIR